MFEKKILDKLIKCKEQNKINNVREGETVCYKLSLGYDVLRSVFQAVQDSKSLSISTGNLLKRRLN